jgi:uncharacterized RDD family membrane protein YckC
MPAAVEITTTQNVTIEYELASLRARMGAFLLDLLIVGMAYFLFFMFVVSTLEQRMNEWWGIFLMLFGFAVYFGYHIVCEVVYGGQTIGKRALNCKVVRLDGKEPRWSDVVLRAMLQMVDVYGTAGIIGIFLIKTTPRQQRFGDLAANTAVIQLRASFERFTLGEILNISSTSNYQPQYPQVRSLTERDMVLIKNTLSRLQKFPNTAHQTALQSLAERIAQVLEIEPQQTTHKEFLTVLLRDYIVLTR